ncbi:type IV pilus modification protein PilV [Halomonas campisalis]|uniref:Type IV pilus modification protein PilV n=1 Tax=Billgrantia campisalis TaxID=74661 RepID=A0ABS9PDH1_9GAMM|nr:type IV pilus modification protein PilV [Halomonas campisalis]MCG6659489.1 type IV pilus modification protein PilV [Halomonas campisalis]MDR5864306.1 type IV pilus modification protein PilV [Halomonas campisalis]
MTFNRQSGFTLIEALVALVVLSIGLLGVAAMQLKALQSAHAGYQRAAASLAAQDAVEMLWSKFDSGEMECPDLGNDEAVWEARWKAIIPGLEGSVSPNGDECVFDVVLKWSDGRLGDSGDAEFTYTTRLPGSRP